MVNSADEVLSFWFEELEPAQHFKKDETLDAEISSRFGRTHELACSGQLDSWRQTAKGRLAEIIVLDQFSRNLYRDDARAWMQDDKALALAQEMVAGGFDQHIDKSQRAFVYMPYMHSESLVVQEESVRLFQEHGVESNIKFAILHRDVIKQFGRFPYRNTVLGRESTHAEVVYTEKHGSF